MSTGTTLFANNTPSNCTGTFSSSLTNRSDDSSCGSPTLTGLDPVLADNGGPTLTHALLPGSSAIDVTSCNTSNPFDQRGVPRDSLCDTGAYECVLSGGSCVQPGGGDTDTDEDGVLDDDDNCPDVANPGQENGDGDADGDVCDACPADADNDIDGDTVCGDVDNCPLVANPGQENADGDAAGDVCDACPADAADDADGDTVCGDVDNCPDVANPGQENGDGDATGDVCDVCPDDPADACGDGAQAFKTTAVADLEALPSTGVASADASIEDAIEAIEESLLENAISGTTTRSATSPPTKRPTRRPRSSSGPWPSTREAPRRCSTWGPSIAPRAAWDRPSISSSALSGSIRARFPPSLNWATSSATRVRSRSRSDSTRRRCASTTRNPSSTWASATA